MAHKPRAETMQENRDRLITSARKAFGERGFAEASMDDLTAKAGLTRGALYHNFGDKKGLLAAVVAQIDGEMAARARAEAARAADPWDGLMIEAASYIRAALDPEVRRIVLLDGPAFLGDPSNWPSQNACLNATRDALTALRAAGILKPVDIETAARLLNSAALNAALWVATSDHPESSMTYAVEVFRHMASGLLTT